MSPTEKHTLHVSKRNTMGKKVSKLRKNGQVPANIFGEDQDSQAVAIDTSELIRHFNSEGDSGLVYLVSEEGKEVPVLFEETQYDVVSGDPLHISFKRVNLKEKVQSEVSLELSGEVDIPGATVFLVRDYLEVEALPTDLPESITIDVSGLTEIGQSLHLADAAFDRAKVTVLLSEEELEEPLVLVQEVKEEVEEEAPEEDGAEGEETPAEEGETSEGETDDSSEKEE